MHKKNLFFDDLQPKVFFRLPLSSANALQEKKTFDCQMLKMVFF